MDTKKREGENYLQDQHLNDAAFQSPEEKKKNQQADITQNGDDIKPDENPTTNTTLSHGNQMDGEAGKDAPNTKELNP